jgi:nucleotide-binding universal stress UspA family protein
MLASEAPAHQVEGRSRVRRSDRPRRTHEIPEATMFARILHANDGSEHAFHALGLALMIAEQNRSELHMVCVEEVPYLPEFVLDAEESVLLATERFKSVLERSRTMAEDHRIGLVTHVFAGHPVQKIVDLAEAVMADLLVIGARGHSALYERMVGSRADRIMQLARCPVLVVK